MSRDDASPKKRGGAEESTRERILAGGAVAFGSLGVARARVEDILRASGVSRPTFYSHFSDKGDVLLELSARHHAEIQQRLLEAVGAQNEPAEQLAAAVDAFLCWRAELGPIGRVLDLEARAPDSALAPHRARTLRELVELGTARMAADGRGGVDPVMWYALMASLECIADQLLSGKRPSATARARATAIGVRLLAGALAEPGDPLPPLPGPPAVQPRTRGAGAGRR